MPRYLWRDQYVAPEATKEYTPIPESAYDRTGYATNVFPEQFALKTTTTYTNQDIPEPYGPPERPLPA